MLRSGTSSSAAAVLAFIIVSLLGAAPAASQSMNYSSEVLADSPVGYWRLGESSGSTGIDQVGANNVTYFGGATLGQSGALIGDANTSAWFNGSDGHARKDSPSSVLNLLNQSWTVEGWAKTSYAGTREQWLASRYECGWSCHVGGAPDAALWALYLDSQGHVVFRVRDDSGALFDDAPAAISTSTVRDGAWHHLVGVLDRSVQQVRVYIDGTQAGSSSYASLVSVTDAGSPFAIGRKYVTTFQDPQGWFEGSIDEIAVYNAALSSARVQAHYDASGRANSADLSLTQAGDWPYGEVGQTVSYRLDVENHGPSLASSAVLAVTAPSGVTVTNAFVMGGANCATLSPVSCDLGDIPPTVTVSVVVTVRLDVQGNLGSAATVTSSTPDYFTSGETGNEVDVRTVGLPPVYTLATSFRPGLLFDSGSSELWRPLNIGSMLAETFKGNPKRHKICDGVGTCVDITSESGFNVAYGHLDLRGSSGSGSFTPNSCSVSGLNECDAGPTSVIYYEPTTDLERGYRYVDYWWFYRWNDSKVLSFDHEGDWEGLVIAIDPTGPPFNTGPPVAAYALYAAHETSSWSAYLGNPANNHTPAYIAEGTHASYPTPDFACGPTDRELCFDGPVPWGRNNDAECAELCVVPLANHAATWLTWPGRWGQHEQGTVQGGESPRSPGTQGRYQCAKAVFAGSCAAPPPRPSALFGNSSRAAQASGDSAIASCDAWNGPATAVLLCDAERLRRSFLNRTLDDRISPPIDIRGFDGRMFAAQGLTQAIGRAITPGSVVTVVGPTRGEQSLRLKVRANGKRWTGAIPVPQLPRGRAFRVSVKQGATAPELELEIPNDERRNGPPMRPERR